MDETASTVEHKAAHDRLINLVASAIKELGRYTRKGVSRPKIRQWMEEHLVHAHDTHIRGYHSYSSLTSCSSVPHTC